MNPESLAARTTNTQLEPIARSIESAVPTTRSGFLPDDHSNQIPKTGKMIAQLVRIFMTPTVSCLFQ